MTEGRTDPTTPPSRPLATDLGPRQDGSMTSRPESYIGTVSGTVRYPEHPDHAGRQGIVGGEPVQVRGPVCASPDDAMDWCRAVLDGTEEPVWSVPFELLHPCTDPVWTDADVSMVDAADDSEMYWITAADDRRWFGVFAGITDHNPHRSRARLVEAAHRERLVAAVWPPARDPEAEVVVVAAQRRPPPAARAPTCLRRPAHRLHRVGRRLPHPAVDTCRHGNHLPLRVVLA